MGEERRRGEDSTSMAVKECVRVCVHARVCVGGVKMVCNRNNRRRRMKTSVGV